MQTHRFLRSGLAAVALTALAQTGPGVPQIARLLTADALKADVSYLASDELEGRGTPSPGLDKAAEYIAAQFRSAGLEPGGDDGYFQTATFETVEKNPEASVTITIDGRKFEVASEAIAVQQAAKVDLADEPALHRAAKDLAALGAEGIRGKVLLLDPGGGIGFGERFQPAAVIALAGAPPRAGRGRAPALREVSATPTFPTVTISDAGVRAAVMAAPNAEIKISAHIAPVVKRFPLRNVVGVLRGSDAALKETCVVVSAHYDHLGVRAEGEGDRIFNGANDDASGTASVMEISRALAGQAARPRRSIVFVAFFGEEEGGLGSRYYAQHPVFPAPKIVANVNLEQLGRTDDTQGPKVGQFNLTGFDFTTMGAIFQQAAKDAGVQAVKDAANSDSYFARSDNARFADLGIPSTTASVAYDFPDYHGVGDEAGKLDYQNMAKVDAALALAVLRIADSAELPQWNAEIPATARYIRARGAGR
ncbi:MAG TPA: M20/M25/M40 family metallo-hydrolase [Bryobacteraceae bacterium]